MGGGDGLSWPVSCRRCLGPRIPRAETRAGVGRGSFQKQPQLREDPRPLSLPCSWRRGGGAGGPKTTRRVPSSPGFPCHLPRPPHHSPCFRPMGSSMGSRSLLPGLQPSSRHPPGIPAPGHLSEPASPGGSRVGPSVHRPLFTGPSCRPLVPNGRVASPHPAQGCPGSLTTESHGPDRVAGQAFRN